MLEKAIEMSVEKWIARKIPVKIWVIKQNERRDPKFHRYEMLEGAGRSINVELIIFKKGLFFRKIIS